MAGRETKANQPVKAGQAITIELPDLVDPAPRPEALPLPILYQDEDLIVVDKPAGMVVHPAAGHASGTLVNALLHHVDDLSGIGGEKRPGIVHRLDRGTSGLMVVAKHDAAHEELSRQFHDREVQKEYFALVWGEVQAGRRIDAPIGRDPANRKKMSARIPVPRAQPHGGARAGPAEPRSGHQDPPRREAPRADARAGRHSYRPDAPDPGTSERDRSPDCRRPACTAASIVACRAICAPSPISIGRSFTPRGSCSSIRGTAAGWSSPASCRKTCNGCSTSSGQT